MATICDRCGIESFVTYVKTNSARICDKCEDEERRISVVPNDWTAIKANNRKRNQLRHGSIKFEKVVFLNSFRQLGANRKVKDKASFTPDVLLPTNLKP